MSETYHPFISKIKGIRNTVVSNKEKKVEAIEQLKPFVSVNVALKIFNISRATYQNYKTLVLSKCTASYFEWCVKRHPNQLLKTEVIKIKDYFENRNYQFWSKASLYYLGLRSNDFSFGLATFYKYSKLLGFKNGRYLYRKPKYSPLISTKPNQIWCADVTIFKTADGVKHYIHFLIDHYSKMVLEYQVASSSQPKIIKSLLQSAFEKHPNLEFLNFVTDGGIENVNNTVRNFVLSSGHKIIHTIAQKDIPESNSMIEAFNKVIKNQFLRPRNLENGMQLEKALKEDILIYCTIRPQRSLLGNTPFETHTGKPINSSNYTMHFGKQKN
ncbi:DDE-type integrase/transposase/recombinase [Flavobacterium aestivum]|uniref:DDE-type integrase/transposase/recombinase n=1 Tax=Flavobacterium aestivum TaxID=3003257 RepID=UPI002482523A|nr:DDE-type integrase/transposase/recombinase [Flavobacterium aestivum]